MKLKKILLLIVKLLLIVALIYCSYYIGKSEGYDNCVTKRLDDLF